MIDLYIQLRGFGADIISIKTDSHGMNAGHLNEVLSNWPDSNSFPKAVYTIPNGSNPTGVSMNLERKKEIYSVNNSWIRITVKCFLDLDCSKI